MNEIVIHTPNPKILSEILKPLHAKLVEENGEFTLTDDGYHIVHCYDGNRDYIVYTLQHQTYAKVVRLR